MTAEAAVVIPALVLLVLMLLGGVMAAVRQIEVVDAARAGARAAARGETPAAVQRAVRSAAPEGAEVRRTREGELVRVRVRARLAGAGSLTVRVGAQAVALAEEQMADDRARGRARKSAEPGRARGEREVPDHAPR